MRYRIEDESRFHGAVARSTLAGLGAGLFGGLLFHVLGLGPWAEAPFLGLSILGVSLAAAPPRTGQALALAAVVASLAAGVAGLVGMPWGLVSLAAIGGLGMAREVDGRGRRVLSGLVGLTLSLAGGIVAAAVVDRGVLSFLPSAVEMPAVGCLVGFFFGLGAVGRELRRAEESPVLPEHRKLDGELGGLVNRALSAFTEAQHALGPAAREASDAASDLLGKIQRFAGRWSDLELELKRSDHAALQQRRLEIGERETGARDDVVRQEYALARESIDKQIEYLDSIQQGRDRAVARLHHHVAVLERLRLAALHHSAVTASAEDLSPLVQDLVAAGRDLDCASEAVAELPALSSI